MVRGKNNLEGRWRGKEQKHAKKNRTEAGKNREGGIKNEKEQARKAEQEQARKREQEQARKREQERARKR